MCGWVGLTALIRQVVSVILRSLSSPGYSIWNPWNPSGIPCGMIMEWSWNGHGMVNSIWNPTLFHMDSTGFHMEFGHIHLGFHMDSMEQVHMDSAEIPYGNTMIFVVKNSVKYEN